jgi:hypothetical protein
VVSLTCILKDITFQLDYLVNDIPLRSDNDGKVDTNRYEPVLDAFTHWTYEISEVG